VKEQELSGERPELELSRKTHDRSFPSCCLYLKRFKGGVASTLECEFGCLYIFNKKFDFVRLDAALAVY